MWYGSPLGLIVLVQFISGLSFGSNALGAPIFNEVIDYDTFLSGKKREAMFQGEVQYMWKLVRLPSEVLPFVMMAIYGYTVKSGPELRNCEQDPDDPTIGLTPSYLFGSLLQFLG